MLLSMFTSKSTFLWSQESQKISPSVQLQYFKDNNENSLLKTTLTFSKNRMANPLKGMSITFYAGGEKKTKLAEVVTDENGVAVYNLKHEADFLTDKNGLWPFTSEFAGNDTIDPGKSDLFIRDVSLNMKLIATDSTKTIVLNVKKKEKGNEVPASGETVVVYVPRMFSLLPIGETKLDESGSASIDFPSDLPGDKEGNLTIIARIEDHPEFGNVEKRTTLKWGSPSSYNIPAGHRALWTKTPPKWMIYTLSILLLGVWGHYLFAIVGLIRIKRNSRKNKKVEIKELFIK